MVKMLFTLNSEGLEGSERKEMVLVSAALAALFQEPNIAFHVNTCTCAIGTTDVWICQPSIGNNDIPQVLIGHDWPCLAI